jgi:hypothetical protein
VFPFTLTARCENGLDLSASDRSGNVEPLGDTASSVKVLPYGVPSGEVIGRGCCATLSAAQSTRAATTAPRLQ